ncbi:SH3 domain-containing protein 19 isoform X2 [Astyanax mexicanus]|uniref:SH3 domain-containing protein 19 isoform X2 n=1 Tax=Astyanax mexicanus TaxID=7994 RepID=UPI0020CAA487|nr:SH3 domain-containing protein 19 isoform X2 [Astyanax mexicanus]
MAEARTEDEEESLRESRGGRNPRLAAVSSERAERNKPEQRQSSQGALSSLRAAIKRTSNRSTAQTDHSRDRRRPEITILSAEPLASNSWFPGASGAFPPPPPPPAQPSWANTGLTVHLPPPSYEQVIREKSREQNLPPPPSLSSSSSSTSSPPSSSRRSTVTIATQTDTHASKSKNRTCPPARRPPKPPRPSLPLIPKPAETSPPHTHTQPATHTPAPTHTPQSEQCGVQTDFSNVPDDLAPQEATPSLPDSSHNPAPANREGSAHPRPRPRPRSKAILAPSAKEEVLDQSTTTMTREVKVQTLVRLKDDGSESVFTGFTDNSSDVSSNKYLQELLDAFAFDELSLQGDQSSESDQNDQNDQSDQSEKSEEEQEEDHIVAPDFAVVAPVASTVPPEPSEPLKRPEPRPRTQNPKPAISPKPSEPTQNVQEDEKPSENQIESILNHPVPAPRPLLTNRSSETNKPDQNVPHKPPQPHQPPRPPVAARRSLLPSALAEASQSGSQTAEVPPKPSVDDQHVEEPAPVLSAPVPSASRTSGRCSSGHTQTSQVPTKPPSQRRPPPPSTTNTQAAVGGVLVSKAPVSSVPSLPPRPKEGKMLPLRPPPMKLPKSAGSSHVPATTNQQPNHRVPKRGPPLPPRPKPGHPLYREYTSKVPQGDTKITCPGTEPEKRCLQQKVQKEELDDTLPPTPPAVLQTEVKGRQDGREDVCLAVKDELVSQQKEVRREQQEEQQLQPNTVQFVSRFAFEGEGDELSFREGDVITLLEYVNEEWGRGSLDGQTGLFPLNFVQEEKRLNPGSPAPPAYEEEGRTGRAMYDFTPESEDELCLKVGDIVCALEEVDEEWYTGEFGGKRGIFPKIFIQVL